MKYALLLMFVVYLTWDHHLQWTGGSHHQFLLICMLLNRFAYPCHYADMVLRFARPVPGLRIITNYMVDLVHNHGHHLLSEFNHNLLSSENCMLYANAIHISVTALDNWWGFIDGTVRLVYRPGLNQRTIYNGHKRIR